MPRAEYRIVRMDETNVCGAAQLAAGCFSHPWSEGAYRRDLAEPRCVLLVCMDGEHVAGFIHCSYVLDELTLNTLAVDAAYRRQGIGRALWEQAAAQVREICHVCYLEVRESNLPARALYESLGFVQNGYRPHYYSDPDEAAVLMALDLAD